MLIISHPTGTEYVSALLAAAQNAAVDVRFFTTLLHDPTDWRFRMAPEKVRRELMKRKFPIAKERVITHEGPEFKRLASSWLKRAGTPDKDALDTVWQDFDAWVGDTLRKDKAFRKGVSGVYAYEDAALNTLKAAAELKTSAVFEMRLAYWQTSQEMLAAEAKRHPDWEPTLTEALDPKPKLDRKEAELQAASKIICPSQFVFQSLPDSLQQKAVVAEFGAHELSQLPERSRLPEPGQPTRLLFAGLMGQRKGLADLFAAMKLLQRPDLELHISGTPLAPMDFYKSQYPDFVYHEPKTHRDLLLLMQECDALVLPSIVEGRALVVHEAMACGLPVIITPNTGCEDLIEPEETGLMVPIRSPEKLAEALSWLADRCMQLPTMSERARRRIAAHTWDKFAEKVLATLDSK